MRLTSVVAILGVAACARVPFLTPDERKALAVYDGRTFYTCCNIHYESTKINDANYHVGELLPLGTSVTVKSDSPLSSSSRRHTNPVLDVDRHDTVRQPWAAVTLDTGDRRFRLFQEYGTNQTFLEYLDKVLLPDDPRPRLQDFPADIREAILRSRVVPGMTREQVVMAIGYPPAHRTPSLERPMWTYWHTRFRTYRIELDEAGLVISVKGAAPRDWDTAAW